MRDTLVPGLRHEATLTVTPSMLVPSLAPQLPPFADMPGVFATAMLVGFLEATCIELLRPHLNAGEHSVGVHVDVSHVAPTPAGATVRAEVELIGIEGRILSFHVCAFDAAGPIAQGSHRRAIIDLSRFMAKTAQRLRDAAKGCSGSETAEGSAQ